MTKLINYAHRGASGYCPENTMAAFSKALELGATGIETDVQMTKDGRLVLIHDEKLTRTAGLDAYLASIDYSDLKKLDAGGWHSPEFAKETVPSLEELLELVKQTDTILNLELKNGLVQYQGLEQKVIETVREYNLSDRVIISSFNHYSLVECKRLAPEIKTGILYMEGLYEPWRYAQSIGANALHAPRYAVLPEWVAEASRNGIDYNPFTVNEPEEMKRLIGAGVAGIITDFPDRLNALL
ncbi:glycerophosphodiester phosphodiesterase [Paenibacillus radicis (ex Gao et al. 2016)]|uniref:Glycerophosphoryl diester phosphodiesterase n=1 Tax=Paenibacillus radicis (ex Gao et al. 2016) TaxID=1737354 RepID=A0A917LWN6_9BACL|nr:glycerophosphodiester phosphodiesterase [Paenibacillus radicis (ex Gao et al. 2016)]GGG62275.1 glycerophosphoryl diester phosphodiesterase [Paenibacillus radicis (ex Gao et al. 2016)]